MGSPGSPNGSPGVPFGSRMGLRGFDLGLRGGQFRFQVIDSGGEGGTGDINQDRPDGRHGGRGNKRQYWPRHDRTDARHVRTHGGEGER